jgi:putative redox protein
MAVQSTQLVENFAFDVSTEDFTVRTDVTEKLGGKNTGPDPHEYLQIALASCTVITCQMYARRKNIPLENINVSVKITAEGAMNEMRREINFIGEKLTPENKDSLLKIAEKCPIHKFLSAGANITSVLV